MVSAGDSLAHGAAVLAHGGIPGQWAMNMTYAALGYGLLGYRLRTYGISALCDHMRAELHP